MTAADIPDALRWDASHAKRTLRGQPLALLQDALRLESQRSRPRKRLQKWLADQIQLLALKDQDRALLQKIEEAHSNFDIFKTAALVRKHERVFHKIIAIKYSIAADDMRMDAKKFKPCRPRKH